MARNKHIARSRRQPTSRPVPSNTRPNPMAHGKRKKVWPIVLLICILIIAIIVIAVKLVSLLLGTGSTPVVAGNSGIVKMSGYDIGVFNTKDEAVSNVFTVDAGIHTISVRSSDRSDVEAQGNLFNLNIVTEDSKNNFSADLSGIGNNEIVVFKVYVGGDGSSVGKLLQEDIKVYYFAVQVINSNPNVTSSPSGSPGGKIWFGEDSYQTYGSELEARNSASVTLPSDLVQNLPISAEPSGNTARIRIKICLVDGSDYDLTVALLSGENNWSGTLDLSDYEGHQLTLMIKAENGMAVVSSYTYVSFFVPVVQ